MVCEPGHWHHRCGGLCLWFLGFGYSDFNRSRQSPIFDFVSCCGNDCCCRLLSVANVNELRCQLLDRGWGLCDNHGPIGSRWLLRFEHRSQGKHSHRDANRVARNLASYSRPIHARVQQLHELRRNLSASDSYLGSGKRFADRRTAGQFLDQRP